MKLQQALGVGGAQVRDQRQWTVPLPTFAPLQCQQLARTARFVIVVQAGNASRVDAQQYRRQRSTQPSFIGRLQQCVKHRQQFLRLFGFKQAALAGGHRWNTDGGQRRLHQGRFGMAAHQHRDGPGLYRRAVDLRLAGARVIQHRADFTDAGLGGQLSRLRRAEGLGRAIGVGLGIGQHAQGQCRCRRSLAQVIGIRIGFARLHRMEADAGIDEGVLACLCIQRLDCAQY